MKAKVKTKSNYKGLNGQWLKVHEMRGKRVSCIVPDIEAKGGHVISDFTIAEIEEFDDESKPNIHPLFQTILSAHGLA